MSISQIDMVVWRDGERQLQVCGDIDPMAGNGRATSSIDPQSFTVVVRQGDSVAALHGALRQDQPTDLVEVEFEPNGRWEVKTNLERQGLFTTGKPAVVSAVVVLKSEPGGLETLSWIQPVTILEKQPPTPLAGRAQLDFHGMQALAQPPEEGLGIGDSVAASLTVLHDVAAGGDTFRRRQRLDKLPPATHLT